MYGLLFNNFFFNILYATSNDSCALKLLFKSFLLLFQELLIQRSQSVLKEGLVSHQHKDSYDVKNGKKATSTRKALYNGMSWISCIPLHTLISVKIEPNKASRVL